jgi:hypothetical protein
MGSPPLFFLSPHGGSFYCLFLKQSHPGLVWIGDLGYPVAGQTNRHGQRNGYVTIREMNYITASLGAGAWEDLYGHKVTTLYNGLLVRTGRY